MRFNIYVEILRPNFTIGGYLVREHAKVSEEEISTSLEEMQSLIHNRGLNFFVLFQPTAKGTEVTEISIMKDFYAHYESVVTLRVAKFEDHDQQSY